MPAFRLLHTSDWHLGALFHDQPRDAEEQRALDAVIAVAHREQVDAVIIAGDIFDSVNPPAPAQALYYRTLLRLVQEAGVGSVMVIGGNHDQGLRLDGPRDVLAAVQVHVRGQLTRDRDPGDVVVAIRSRQGSTVGWAALVPYLREGDVASFPLGRPSQAIAEQQAAAQSLRLAAVRAALKAKAQGLPTVAVAHAFAAGGQLGGSERPVYAEAVVGRLSCSDLTPLAEGSAYLALGHLHRPQRVGGRDHWRYCGSLLPMAMDETVSQRQVLIAEIPVDGGPAAVREIPLPGGRRYARLQGTPAEVQGDIPGLAAPAAGDLEPWCDVTVDLSATDPGLVRDIEERIVERGWRALAVRRRQNVPAGTLWASGTSGARADLQQLRPADVFQAVASGQGVDLSAELTEDFARLLAMVQQAES